MLSKINAYVAYARKVAVYVVQVAAQLIALGLVHGTALHVAQAVIAMAGAVGVYATRNADSAAIKQLAKTGDA